eukprot:6826-Pelagococcus_subviridis.AAC.1
MERPSESRRRRPRPRPRPSGTVRPRATQRGRDAVRRGAVDAPAAGAARRRGGCRAAEATRGAARASARG